MMFLWLMRAVKANTRPTIFVMSLFSSASFLMAQSGGVLPKGKTKTTQTSPPSSATTTDTGTSVTQSVGAEAATSTVTNLAAKPKSFNLSPCQDVFANVRGGEGFFSKEGQAFYFVSRPPSRSKVGEGLFDIYSFDIVTGVIKRMLGVEFRDSFHFLGQGFPISALGIFDFKEFGPECLQGLGSIQTLVLLNKKNPKLSSVFAEGSYAVLYGSRTFSLLDNLDGTVKEYDLVSGQKRVVAKIKGSSTPFLFDKPNNKLLTYEFLNQELVVSKLSLPAQKVELKTTLPAQGRVFVDGDRIAFLLKDVDANEITIQEVKGFTANVNVSHTFQFPKGYSVLESGFVGNLDKRLLAVTAFKQEKRRRWTRTFLVDYLSKKIVTVQKIPENHYVSSTYFNTDGSLWISVIKDENGRLAGLSVYNLAKNKWFTPKLP